MTDVRIETVAAPVLYIPGPNASKAGCILSRIRDLAVEGMRFMKYAEECRLDTERMERIEEELHAATRPMRHGLTTSNYRLAAEIQARDMGITVEHDTDAEEAAQHEPTGKES